MIGVVTSLFQRIVVIAMRLTEHLFVCLRGVYRFRTIDLQKEDFEPLPVLRVRAFINPHLLGF